MSIESAKAFFEKLKTDAEFAKQINNCTDAVVRRAFVEAAGFNFTAEEINAASREISKEYLKQGFDRYCSYE